MTLSPLRIGDPADVAWDATADVVVVGFGAAGSCAALEARAGGASVILVDKFEGGGTTALSGGVVYAGATRFQQEAGYEDSVDEMIKYLELEVGDIVGADTLRRFCENSAGNLDWLISHGATYGARLAKPDEAYDVALSAGASLYFSGNEFVRSYAAVAKPAPRGHITVGPGFGSKGVHLFAALRAAVERMGVETRLRSPVRRLVLDAAGNVVGVEVVQIAPGSPAWRLHRLCERLYHKGKGNLYGPPARLLARGIAWAERSGVPKRIRATGGVVLATGGFINNRRMLSEYLPQHLNAIPMGSAGCLGDGIRLGQSIGALTRMDCGESGRSLLVPKPFKYGLLVNRAGERFIAEDAYGLTIGHEIFQQDGHAAWLILDAEQFRAAWRLVMPWRPMILRYRVRALMPLLFAWRRSGTLEGLAGKCGIQAEGLRRTFDRYDGCLRNQQEDWLGKLPPNIASLGPGPYYAIDCSPDSKGFPPTSLTLGGLLVDERSGQVRGADQSVIGGLYAAGRAAVGLPSNFNVSGLSIADCVFSGRRAGRAAAKAAQAGGDGGA
ncbi:FAD-binding protein [Castellaniella sp. GW247-6E4]|uniref:FAD-binding protein n=1 Tax=Castellaniella sp. GW247-6E4 TaxID=3140380 RepID=UPI00331492A9